MAAHCQGVQSRIALVVNFLKFLKLNVFCFVVATSEVVHDVENKHGLR